MTTMIIPKIVLVENRTQIVLSVITLATVLYFGFTTAFIQNGTVDDTIVATLLPLQLLALYVWFPIGFALWLTIIWGYKKNFWAGIFMTFLFGLNAAAMLFLPLMTLFFGGSILGAFIVLMTMIEVGYGVKHDAKKIAQRFSTVFVIFFCAMILSMVIDFLFGFSGQYQMVANHAVTNLPDNIHIDVGAPLTAHVMLWQGVVMLALMAITDMIKSVDIVR